MRVPIRSADLTFLNMDRPSNLMVVNGVFWFDEEPDWGGVRGVVLDRLVGRFPVLSRRPVNDGGTWMWEDDPTFDLDRHVRMVSLPAGAGGVLPDLAAAQDHICERVSQPLRRDRPLWEMDCVSGMSGKNGEPVALFLARFHHGLADGIRLVQLALSLCDVAEGADATPPRVGRGPSSQGLAGRAVGLGKHVVADAVDFAEGMAGTTLRSARGLPSAAAGLRPHDVPHVIPYAVGHGVGLVSSPTHVSDAITGVASTDNRLVNSVRSASRLAIAGHSPHLLGEAGPGVAKRVAWASGIDLDAVKAIGRRHDATVNDVLVAAVARGLSRYVREKGHQPAEAVNWLIPVSLKPMEADLPSELGNHFAMVMFPMPLDGVDDDGLIREITSRMNRTKNSAEAMMVYGFQKAIAATPPPVAVGLTDFVANKTVGVLTNVPGPGVPLYLAGTRVTGVLGWVPTASDQWLGICIFSYDGTVSMGITSDAGLMPDPGRLAALIKEEFDVFAAE